MIAAAAIGAVTAYRRKVKADPEGASNTVRNIRQSTSVVLAIGDAIWAVLDALMLVLRRTGGPQVATASGPRFGTRAASDE